MPEHSPLFTYLETARQQGTIDMDRVMRMVGESGLPEDAAEAVRGWATAARDRGDKRLQDGYEKLWIIMNGARYPVPSPYPDGGPMLETHSDTPPGPVTPQTQPPPPPRRDDPVARTREGLTSLVNTYESVKDYFHIQPGDTRSRSIREIERRLPWDENNHLRITEPMRVGGITIQPGDYTPDSLLDTIGDQLDAPERARRAVRGTPMPGTTRADDDRDRDQGRPAAPPRTQPERPHTPEAPALVTTADWDQGRAKVSETFRKSDQGEKAQDDAARDLNNLSLAKSAHTPEGKAKAAAAMVGLRERGVIGGQDMGSNGPPPAGGPGYTPSQPTIKGVVEVAR